MRIHYYIIFSTLTMLLHSCLPYEEEVAEIDKNIFRPEIQQIHNFQSRNQVDSLLTFFTHNDASIRYAAVKAFASFKDERFVDTIAYLLEDRNDIVRAAAAHAIGQTESQEATPLLIKAFEQYDTSGYFGQANRSILEAVGKCGNENDLANLAAISTYQSTDTLLLEGQALGIFRFAGRKIISDPSKSRMINLATDAQMPYSARIIAAAYLANFNEVSIDSSHIEELNLAIQTSNQPNLTAFLVEAMGKTAAQDAIEPLKRLYTDQVDVRVKCSILKAIQNLDYNQVNEIALAALRDPNPNVSKCAIAFYINAGVSRLATNYWRMAKDTFPWQVQIGLYQAANRHLPNYFVDTRELINYELRRRYDQAGDEYRKVPVINALAEFPWNYRYLYRRSQTDSSLVIKSATLEAIAKISRREDFEAFFGAGKKTVSREIATYFKTAIESGHIGLTTIAAYGLMNKDRKFEEFYENMDFLKTAQATLPMPKAVEAYNALEKAIKFFEDAPYEHLVPESAKDINWSALNNIKSTSTAAIKTSKGTINISFFYQDSPGTVANFISLANDKFYDGLNFHRVVPNFVIQGGSPTGDAYGSTDFVIRSELPDLNYDAEGYLGIANAGVHTGNCQFFITQLPTFKLDGKHTIFAKVIKGMDIVQRIAPGDEIEFIDIRL